MAFGSTPVIIGAKTEPSPIPFDIGKMEDDQIIALAALVIILLTTTQRPPVQWTRQWILRRTRLGAYHALMQEMQVEDQFLHDSN